LEIEWEGGEVREGVMGQKGISGEGERERSEMCCNLNFMEGAERSLSMARFSAPMTCHANGLAMIGSKCLVASWAASRLPARGYLYRKLCTSMTA
jgi:hypothetical protein